MIEQYEVGLLLNGGGEGIMTLYAEEGEHPLTLEQEALLQAPEYGFQATEVLWMEVIK